MTVINIAPTEVPQLAPLLSKPAEFSHPFLQFDFNPAADNSLWKYVHILLCAVVCGLGRLLTHLETLSEKINKWATPSDNRSKCEAFRCVFKGLKKSSNLYGNWFQGACTSFQ